MKRMWPIIFLGMGLTMTGCVMASVAPPSGLIFTRYIAPLTTNFNATPRGSRVVTSEAMYLREPFFGSSWAWGDASIQAIARNSGLTQVYYADYEYLQVLGLFARVVVRVHGD